ncbi:MAG: hypothetical protein H6667_18910 [Ardenticatenaceae bacterium]|nr:hypothetical protein [Ardenticatenaceae bacterium]
MTAPGIFAPLSQSWPAAQRGPAGVTAVLAADLPYNMGLIIAALTGIFIGYLAESWQK